MIKRCARCGNEEFAHNLRDGMCIDCLAIRVRQMAPFERAIADSNEAIERYLDLFPKKRDYGFTRRDYWGKHCDR